ncbi:cupin domain-containing protein [Nodosilinea sp. PGN35]|uniref:cupin domain-containing protein n=1 Tax=Nodosilinea sp. PGN35 TaxID=3020489 RepID=UPI0023B263D8|nr:cupin domain-containing protein [Nodosilinea sp. TSF1-S3]MDF0366326.1 cupin domain-containing protein [Nodosilinea sp. TSF1-S3]
MTYTEINTEITNETNLIPIQADLSLLEQPKKLSTGDIKTLDEIAEFNPRFFVRRRIFLTDTMHFNIYCIEPGQSNPLHKHSGSDEILYFVQGSGDVIVGDEIAAIEAGACVHVPKDTGHEILNTGSDRMIVVLAQSPLPCLHEKVPNPPAEYRRVAAAKFSPEE